MYILLYREYKKNSDEKKIEFFGNRIEEFKELLNTGLNDDLYSLSM